MRNKYILFLILSLLVINDIIAQTPRPGRRDTLWGASWQPWHQQIMQAPVLNHPERRKNIAPQEKICFDKKIFMKGTANGRVQDMYIYINTIDGVVGLQSGREESLGDGSILPQNERFRLIVFSKKGNVYNYFNRKKNRIIEHYVTTGNSNTFLTDLTFRDGDDVVYKKSNRNIYCDNTFKTWLYKAEGSGVPEFHLFGKNYPNKLVCNDFIGNSGIGYLLTDNGLYLICEMKKGGNNFEMRSFKDMETCFDPTEFKILEPEFQSEMTESLEKEKEKLDAERMSGDCDISKINLNNFKKELNEKKKRNLEQTREGNVYQNQNTQKAYANMMDPIDMAQESILDMNLKICQTLKIVDRNNGVTKAKAEAKLQCLLEKKRNLISAKTQMEALDRTYATNPGKAYVEKNKLLVQNMAGCK